MPPSPSVATTVPILIWFSSTTKELIEVNIGALSLILVMVIVIYCVALNVPSVALIVNEYDCLVS